MIISVAQNILAENTNVLKSRVTKIAYQGVIIATLSVILANLVLSYYLKGEISLAGIVAAQAHNYALWILYSIPFLFAFWGQYSSTIIVYEAGALIVDQTRVFREKAENLKQQADYAVTHDALTDLPNRALFYDRVNQAIISANIKRKLLSVFIIEIDNFKEIYDTLGLTSSDIVLKQIATRFQGVVSGTDNLAKIDGNKFSFLSSDLKNTAQVEQIAQNIYRALELPFLINGLRLSVNANVGIVHFPEHGSDVDTLVQRAGVALYMARYSNYGYAVYDPSYDEHSPRRLTLMSELRQAIDTDLLELYYQPKISIDSGVLYGAEALVRWNHPKHGLISPDEFIPMAERTRMIRPLTKWVLKQAFNDSSKWHKKNLDLTISVNLSARDLHDPELPDLMAGIVGSTDVKPERIILEITESSIMIDPERTLEIIKRLDRMGFKLSIDDYGTGYSSLAYLKKMPLTELKIDRSFVMDILKSENDEVIVKATINLAHNLDLQVTAEGVEDEKIASRLKAYGCDIAQGYYYSRPMPVEGFNKWMKNSQWKSVPLSRNAKSVLSVISMGTVNSRLDKQQLSK